MRVAAAVLLLVLQLKPLVGTAICIENLSTTGECPMPIGQAPGQTPAPAPHEPGHGFPAPGCPAADFCAPLAPAIGAVPVILSTPISERGTSTSFLPGLHSVEPAAPPAPPPNR